MRVDSASACGESNGSRSVKKTSASPITPSPIGRHRPLAASASGVG
jgi:hypothetical protein